MADDEISEKGDEVASNRGSVGDEQIAATGSNERTQSIVAVDKEGSQEDVVVETVPQEDKNDGEEEEIPIQEITGDQEHTSEQNVDGDTEKPEEEVREVTFVPEEEGENNVRDEREDMSKGDTLRGSTEEEPAEDIGESQRDAVETETLQDVTEDVKVAESQEVVEVSSDSQYKKSKVTVFADDIETLLVKTSMPSHISSRSVLEDETTLKLDLTDTYSFPELDPLPVVLIEEKRVFDRNEITKKYHEAKTTNFVLKKRDTDVQIKLLECILRRKRSADRQPVDKNAPDPDLIYNKYIVQFQDLQEQLKSDIERSAEIVQLAADYAFAKKRIADRGKMKFLDHKKQVTLGAWGRQTGKPLPAKDVEMAVFKEEQKEIELTTARLEHLMLKYTLERRQRELKKREEFTDGLQLFDFELLKIENETCNEKIEEKNEELHKLRKKNSSTIQILTHLKEKLKSVQRENIAKKTSLKDVEVDLCQSRQVLSKTKEARDVLRRDNMKQRHQSGLMSHGYLLRDLEESVDKKLILNEKLKELKEKHGILLLECAKIKQNIERIEQYNRAFYANSSPGLKKVGKR